MRPFDHAPRPCAAALACLCLAACNDESGGSAAGAPRLSPPPAIQEDAPGFSGNNAYAHCAALCALGPRTTGSAAYARQLEYLAGRLEQAGWQPARQGFSLSNGRRMTNLHATFGAADKPRPLLISCHIDTKQGIPGFIGADDGASGAAVMIELARALAASPDLAQQIEFVFFDGEESFAPRMTDTDGLYGSRYDVLRRQRSGSLPRWQINLDMVGARNKTIAVPVWDTDPDLLERYAAAVASLGLSPDRWFLYPGSYLDDHRPFAEAGVATLNLICQFQKGGWWHTAKDDLSRISPDSLGETGRLVLHLAQCLLGDANESVGAQ